jgi:hypothetical protein
MKALHSQRSRVLAILQKGPARCQDISLATGIGSASVSRAARSLVAQGLVVRIDRDAQFATYALCGAGHARKAPAQDRPTILHGAAYRAAEEAYVAGRKAGSRPGALATRLGLTDTATEVFEKAYRYQTCGGNSSDNSCPKFAEHGRHLAAVGRVGRFPVMPAAAGIRRRA